jgi:hypothetical protein
MSSWRNKLANKTTTAVTNDSNASNNSNASHASSINEIGWKQRINEKKTHTITQEQKPIIPKISIDDLNEFPMLGKESALPSEKQCLSEEKPFEHTCSEKLTQKQTTLTGFAALAKKWSNHDKEEKQREEKEQMYREQQENTYNYNISKLNIINNRLMAFNNYSQVKYNDEYNADYEHDLQHHNDEYM